MPFFLTGTHGGQLNGKRRTPLCGGQLFVKGGTVMYELERVLKCLVKSTKVVLSKVGHLAHVHY